MLGELDILYRAEDFKRFFDRIEHHRQRYGDAAAAPIEGYNGFARSLDSLVKVRGYQFYNINSLKFTHFKEIFSIAAKSIASMRVRACSYLSCGIICRWLKTFSNRSCLYRRAAEFGFILHKVERIS